MKIAVCSMEDKHDEFFDKVSENHRSYCRERGYEYYEVRDFGKYGQKPESHWHKFDVIWDVLNDESLYYKPGHVYVLWVDMDAIFTNFDIGVEDYVKKFDVNASVLMSKDCCGGRCKWDMGWNNGVFLMRVGDRLKRLVNIMRSRSIAELFNYMQTNGLLDNWKDQNAFCWLLDEVEDFRGMVQEISAKGFNSYVKDRAYVGNEWGRGDFILHLAGQSQEERMAYARALGIF